MAAEDVPADQINDRIGEWAASVGPEAYQTRVAKLLNVTPQQDAGQPARLALSNFSSQEEMVAEAAASAPAPQLAANGELPAIGMSEKAVEPALAPASAASPTATERPKTRFAASFGSPVKKAAPSVRKLPGAVDRGIRIAAR